MSKYQEFKDLCFNEKIVLTIAPLPGNIKGLYFNSQHTHPIIILHNALNEIEKTCIIAEELGHHYTSCGNSLINSDLSYLDILKQEYLAKTWAVNKLVPLENFKKAIKKFNNVGDISKHLGITLDLLLQAYNYYKLKKQL